MTPEDANREMREENAIRETILAARRIQTFLWGQANGQWGLEEWRRMFRKRVAKLDAVKADNPHAAVEVRKRLLQTAALAVALIAVIDRQGLPERAGDAPPSNLPQYSGKSQNRSIMPTGTTTGVPPCQICGKPLDRDHDILCGQDQPSP